MTLPPIRPKNLRSGDRGARFIFPLSCAHEFFWKGVCTK
nr:MAG TPA: hypothetical protein [Caudoviricetes sp.]